MSHKKLHPLTAILNQKQKHQSKIERLKALHWLAKKFPEAFNNQLKIRPLKTGIMHDLLAYTDEAAKEGISKAKLREAVVTFTRRVDYLTCLKAKEMRIDLHGNPTAFVTQDEAEKAALKIKNRVEKATRHAQQNIANKVAQYYQKQTAAPRRKFHEKGNVLYSTPPATTSHTPSITVKRKFTTSVHAQTVTRLKERLGLTEE